MISNHTRYIFLADDDEDDLLLFREALSELALPTQLTTVHDGEELMKLLAGLDDLPHVLFLDLNMPRKDGFQCLLEIKQNEKLKQLPVIVFSTSFQPDTIDQLYKNGAQYYIRKPSDFERFKKVIYSALSLTAKFPVRDTMAQYRPSKEEFVL